MSKSPIFNDIKISTKTILAKINCILNLDQIFKSLPITHYEIIKRKRGRKRKEDCEKQVESILSPGSIISINRGDEIRGVCLKNNIKKKKDDENVRKYMRNCVTVVIFITNKRLSIKLFNNEKEGNAKFHITGCKAEDNAEEGVLLLWDHITKLHKNSIKEKKEPIYTLIKNSSYKRPTIIFKTSMTNIDFNLGFHIDRRKLNILMNNHDKFLSSWESSLNTGVNIKLESDEPLDIMLKCITISKKGNKTSWVPNDEFKDKRGKVKKYTFLVFQSGACIFSSPYSEMMEDVYNHFTGIISKNQKKIKEIILK